jgi:hypothetical protein
VAIVERLQKCGVAAISSCTNQIHHYSIAVRGENGSATMPEVRETVVQADTDFASQRVRLHLALLASVYLRANQLVV